MAAPEKPPSRDRRPPVVASDRPAASSRFARACAALCIGLGAAGAAAASQPGALSAGAAAVDITPRTFPVIVNGGFLSARARRAHDRLSARCIVLSDGACRVAIVVVDNCMLPRTLADRAKALAAGATGIPADHVIVAATHTHSTPAVMSCLGTEPDPNYTAALPALIARSVEIAAARLAPASVGFAVVEAPDHTHCRRWILRPDRVGLDPFGGRTVRAMMHPGHCNPAYVGPAGPVDPGVTVLSVRTRSGRPLALLANFSMHYYGAPAVSADYFGAFCDAVAHRLAPDDPQFVAVMSQGTSGDLQWMDYARPPRPRNLRAYAESLAEMACAAARRCEYQPRATVASACTELALRRRTPDAKRLAWARKVAESMGPRPPRNRVEVYAAEQLRLHAEPRRALLLQAVRVGPLGLTAIPNEVFGITGLKLKARSPLQPTCNLGLANGSEGYIPPPEQHALGGYTTWPARTAGLEPRAEPKIVDALLGLLEKLAGRPRRDAPGDLAADAAYPRTVLAARPLAYWRLGEFEHPRAHDATGAGNHATYEPGIAPYLEGPDSPAFSGRRVNRAPQFAGGRLRANLPALAKDYTVEFWFRNDLPTDARAVTGYLFSRGPAGHPTADGDHLAVEGTHRPALAGRLVFYNGDRLRDVLAGRTAVGVGRWHHAAMVRRGQSVRVWLDGRLDIDGRAAACPGAGGPQLFCAGRNDGFAPFQGRMDEIALYARALTEREITAHYNAAGPRR